MDISVTEYSFNVNHMPSSVIGDTIQNTKLEGVHLPPTPRLCLPDLDVYLASMKNSSWPFWP